MKISLNRLYKAISELHNVIPYSKRDTMIDVSIIDEESGTAIGNVITIKAEYVHEGSGRNVNKTLTMEITPDGDGLPNKFTETNVLEF